MPDSRRDSSLIRSPRPPASTAACITRSRAKATPNSCPKRQVTRVFSPAGGRSCARSRTDPSAACNKQRRLAGDERRLGLLEPRHRLARPCAPARRARPGAPRAGPRSAPRGRPAPSAAPSPRGRSSPSPRRGRAPPRRPSTHMPRPGSRPGEVGDDLAVGAGHEADQPGLRPGLAGDDAAPLRLVPLLHPSPARHRLRPGPPPRPRAASASAPRRSASSSAARARPDRPSRAGRGRSSPASAPPRGSCRTSRAGPRP